MAVASPQVTQSGNGKGVVTALCLTTLLSSGCISVNVESLHTAVKPKPSQVVVRWINEIATAPDPARGGVPAPGLVGRVYLFGTTIDHPKDGDGSLTVELFNAQQPGPDGRPRLLERWNIDAATMARLQRKDAIGPGYSLFLPWGSYRPEITQIHLRTCYQPKEGTPLYHNSGLISLGGVIAPPTPASSTSGPAVAQPPMPRTAPPVSAPTKIEIPRAAPLPGPASAVPSTPQSQPSASLQLPPGSGLKPRPGGGVVIDKGLGPWTTSAPR